MRSILSYSFGPKNILNSVWTHNNFSSSEFAHGNIMLCHMAVNHPKVEQFKRLCVSFMINRGLELYE